MIVLEQTLIIFMEIMEDGSKNHRNI